MGCLVEMGKEMAWLVRLCSGGLLLFGSCGLFVWVGVWTFV